MGKHRVAAWLRGAPVQGSQRNGRPRYRRIGAAAFSALVTAVAVLGGSGILPTRNSAEPAYAAPKESHQTLAVGQAVQLSLAQPPTLRPRSPGPPRVVVDAPLKALPSHSGKGRRVVFDMSDQQVWLVGARGKVVRRYLVSGSVTDNLDPGRYEVYSRSRHAVGVDDSGVMQYMVRFTQGAWAAIGFHDIPVHRGKPVQTRQQLGTPMSHGCIRQARPDAIALWRFAPVGTRVVVLD